MKKSVIILSVTLAVVAGILIGYVVTPKVHQQYVFPPPPGISSEPSAYGRAPGAAPAPEPAPPEAEPFLVANAPTAPSTEKVNPNVDIFSERQLEHSGKPRISI